MCGSPAVPNMSAMPREIASSGLLTSLPGTSTPAPYCRAASAKSAAGLRPKRSSTSSASRSAPVMSSPAFTICTQVVAIIPPNST